MASTITETVTVTSLGKWGPKVGDEYYSWSKNIKEADKGKVVPGGTYTMELYIADSSKRYINSVASAKASSAPLLKPLLPKQEVKSAFEMKPGAIKLSDAMTRTDWDAKDRRISRQGCIQVAVQITSSFDEAVVLAEKMLGFVNG